MGRKGKNKTDKEKNIKGQKLEKHMDKERRDESDALVTKTAISPGVLKKPSPSKSVNFVEDKRAFTNFVKVRLEIEAKRKKEWVYMKL